MCFSMFLELTVWVLLIQQYIVFQCILKTITSLFTAPKRCSYISESRYLYVKLQ